VLTVSNLRRQYGDILAVNNVCFSVSKGECFGLLGPNGAGKTTTISIICGILRPDSGQVLIDGQQITSDTSPIKQRIGYVPQDLALYEELDAISNLRLFGALYHLSGDTLGKRIDEALTLTGLADRAHEPITRFSGGMKRRLNIGAALLHDPDLLIFDEPTVGVDPQSRNAIFDTLKALQSRGKTLIYTTHYMEEVERLCDRVAIMDHGQIIANDTLPGLRGLLPDRDRLQVELTDVAHVGNGLLEQLNTLAGVRLAQLDGTTLSLGIDHIGRDVPTVLTWLDTRNVQIRFASTRQTALEDIFLHLTGRSLRD
jgi:linearmycin/streptolysin S transport system ATP-binding protein